MNAKTFLEKRYSDELDLHDAVHTAVLTLKEVFYANAMLLCVVSHPQVLFVGFRRRAY